MRKLKGIVKKTWTSTGPGDSFFVTIKLQGEGNYGVNFIKSGDEISLNHKPKTSKNGNV